MGLVVSPLLLTDAIQQDLAGSSRHSPSDTPVSGSAKAVVPLEQNRHASSFCGTSRGCACSFAKLVAGNVENGEAPTLCWEGLEIRPDKNLDCLFTGINLDSNRIIAKVYLVASSVLSSHDGVGHYHLVLMIAGR
jgi:hypothetical protein